MNGYLEILTGRKGNIIPFNVLQIPMCLDIIDVLHVLDVSVAVSFPAVKLNSTIAELCES